MKKREPSKTLEEYSQRRRLYGKIIVGIHAFYFPLIVGASLFLFIWNHGILQNFNIALYGAIGLFCWLVSMALSLPKNFLKQGQNTEFFPLWLSALYERLPQWVKNLVARSCAKHPDSTPEAELLRIARGLKKPAVIFLLAGIGVFIYMFYVIKTNLLALGTLNYYNHIVDMLETLS